MADRWYFAWGDKAFGPFSAPELKELAALGRLQPTDPVWKEGMENRVLAVRVKNLFPEVRVTARPADANEPAAYEPWSSSLRRPETPSTTPHSAPKLAPWLPVASVQAVSGEDVEEKIPDGVILRVPQDQK